MTALAGLSSIATLISFLSGWETNNHSAVFLELLALGVVGLCLFYAIAMSYEKSKISLSLNSGFEITIEKGDLFRKSGIIVIPVNEYFDTIVDDEIISSHSVHGKWINQYWSKRIPELDRQIENELTSKKAIEESDRERGKKMKYNLGECISIQVPNDNNLYVLFVMTHFDKDNHAYLDHKDYPIVIDKLFKFLAHIGTDRRVYMPLIGSGLSRLNRSPQRILTFMLDAIDFKHSNLSFPQGLYIELHSLSKVNLNQIEDLFLSNIHQE